MSMPLPAAMLLLSLPLGGCEAAAGAFAGVDTASITIFGRGIIDAGVSAVSGRDCSVVRLDRLQPYCAPREQLPGAPEFCSRTLGDAECWADPQSFVILPRELADTPAPTADQVKQINARWPKSF